MQHAVAEADDGLEAIVSDLMTLVGHVRDSLALINGVLARETSFGDPDAANVIVLDDVTPQYQKARHALQACSADLGGALQSLLDARASSHPCHDIANPASQKA